MKFFKLNTDGCRKDGGESAVGGLVKNSDGGVCVSFCAFMGAGSYLMAELLDIL